MEELRHCNAAAFVLSCLPRHRDTDAAFVDAATGTGTGTGGSLSFSALRRGALSLASALRLGLGLRRGDAVLVLSHNSLILPQVLLGVLLAGGVVVAADADADIAAAAHASAAVMVVAAPELVGKVAAVAVGLPPLLLTSQQGPGPGPGPTTLSAEELIHGGDPTATAAPAAADVGPGLGSDVAFLAYPSAIAMTHADLVDAVGRTAGKPDDDAAPARVCLASLPMCSAHGLPLLALGLPAAGVTTVLLSQSDPRAAREAVAAHGATDLVATPEAAAQALLAAPMPLDDGWKLSTLRRVMVAPTPLTPEAREEFRRRLPWVQLSSCMRPEPEPEPEPELITPTVAAVIEHNSLPADTNEAASPSLVPPPKINKIISGDIFSRSTMSKILRKHPVTGNGQAASKL